MFYLICRPFEMVNLYVSTLLQYARFDGRAGRRELCLFFGTNIFIFAILCGPAQQAGGAVSRDAPLQFALSVMIPGIALIVRRMHDCGKKGWYLFIPVYNLILIFSRGGNGLNESDPDPEAHIAGSKHRRSDQPVKGTLPASLREDSLL